MEPSQTVPPLNRFILNAEEKRLYDQMKKSPVTVLQIGEGRFLRGFADWMIHELRKQKWYDGTIALTQPRPSGRTNIGRLKRQDGLYTLMTRGIFHGETVDRREIVSVFSDIVDPYADWDGFIRMAAWPTLQFVISNTTEAGLAYQPEAYEEGKPVHSFPGKLALLLYARFRHFDGDPDKGLIMLPCELVERNGDVLKERVMQYSAEWKLPDRFIRWVDRHNRFLNTLVDRIVTGCSVSEAEAFFLRMGYEDHLLIAAEPYYLWAIEAEQAMDDLLPLQKAGLHVRWVDDLTPFQLRKVRILNGAHTLMAPLCMLHGLSEVKEVMEHPLFGTFIREAMKLEIVPTLPYAREELLDYAGSVIERFLNPYLHHRLADISLNSISKCRARVLPTLEAYFETHGKLPERIVYAFAALIRFYQVRKSGMDYAGTRFDGSEYTVQDEAGALEFFSGLWSRFDRKEISLAEAVKRIVGNEPLWGKSLLHLPGFYETVCAHVEGMMSEAP